MESIVVMGVMMVVLGATHAFLANGVSFYQNTVQSLEVQQQALVGMTKMSEEIENTNFDKIVAETDSIVFPSVVASDGTVDSTKDTGRLLWQSFICFLPATLPTGGTGLVRRIDAVSSPVDFPPNPLSPPGGGPPRDKAFFTGRPSTTVLVRNLDAFLVTTSTDAVTLELSVKFSASRTADKMTIQTKVYPKN